MHGIFHMKTVKKAGFILLVSAVSFAGPRVNVVSYDELKNATQRDNDTLYVVNFWATWCDPCVHELPVFQQAYVKYASKKVKMVFVSMNSAKDIAKVEKFAQEKDLKPQVLLLGSNKMNVWINNVDTSWDGAIPVTALYRHGKKLYFHQGEFTQQELNTLIQSKLK